MIIKCYDGFLRDFRPADNAAQHVRVSSMKATPAYCVHCNTKFTMEQTVKQKEEWRKHTCDGHVYGSANIKKL